MVKYPTGRRPDAGTRQEETLPFTGMRLGDTSRRLGELVRDCEACAEPLLMIFKQAPF